MITREDRQLLNSSNKAMSYYSFVKGFSYKFRASNTIISPDNISVFANLRIEMQKHITGIGANSVLFTLKFSPGDTLIGPGTSEGSPSYPLAYFVENKVLMSIELMSKQQKDPPQELNMGWSCGHW